MNLVMEIAEAYEDKMVVQGFKTMVKTIYDGSFVSGRGRVETSSMGTMPPASTK